MFVRGRVHPQTSVQTVAAHASFEDVIIHVAGQGVGIGRAPEIFDGCERVAFRVSAFRGPGQQIDPHRGRGAFIGCDVASFAAMKNVGTEKAAQNIVPGITRKRVVESGTCHVFNTVKDITQRVSSAHLAREQVYGHCSHGM